MSQPDEPTPDKIAPGSTANYCEKWPTEGHNFQARKPANAQISVRFCAACGWIDGPDLEQQVAERIAKHPVVWAAAVYVARNRVAPSQNLRPLFDAVAAMPPSRHIPAAARHDLRYAHDEPCPARDEQCDLVQRVAGLERLVGSLLTNLIRAATGLDQVATGLVDAAREAAGEAADAWQPAQPGETPGTVEPDDARPQSINLDREPPTASELCECARWRNGATVCPVHGTTKIGHPVVDREG